MPPVCFIRNRPIGQYIAPIKSAGGTSLHYQSSCCVAVLFENGNIRTSIILSAYCHLPQECGGGS